MALVIGGNSWETIAEADAYLTNVIGTASWFALPDTALAGVASKELWLIMAYNMLVNKAGYCLEPTLTDANVKNAQSELAFYFVDNYATFIAGTEFQNKGVSEFALSKWRERYFQNWDGDFSLPTTTAMYLNDYRCDNVTVDLEVE